MVALSGFGLRWQSAYVREAHPATRRRPWRAAILAWNESRADRDRRHSCAFAANGSACQVRWR